MFAIYYTLYKSGRCSDTVDYLYLPDYYKPFDKIFIGRFSVHEKNVYSTKRSFEKREAQRSNYSWELRKLDT